MAVFGALLGWFVRSTVRAEILAANEVQLRLINGTYVRAAGSTATGAEVQADLAEVKAACKGCGVENREMLLLADASVRRDVERSTADLGALRDELRDLLLYAHSGLHELRNKLQAMELLRTLPK